MCASSRVRSLEAVGAEPAGLDLDGSGEHRTDDFDGGGFVTSLDEYSLLTATVRWEYSDRLQMFARLDNITDETYEEVWGFAAPRFGIYAGATILLGGDD